MTVTKQIEWAMGHRVLNHKSKCKNLHGHHYKLEICLEGKLISKKGVSEEGMVIDFGDVKAIAMTRIYDKLDHGFVVWKKDKVLKKFFEENPDQKHVVISWTPTCENLALWIFQQLDKEYKDTYGTGLRLHEVKLWETPTSFAICNRKDLKKQ